MKKLKENQKHGCTWCKKADVKTQAVWRQSGMASAHACDAHQPDLQEYERVQAERDSRMTEADYQTWGRL